MLLTDLPETNYKIPISGVYPLWVMQREMIPRVCTEVIPWAV